jgi:hypothetical protein
MKTGHVALVIVALSMASIDSIAQSGAPSAKVVIPEWKKPVDFPAFDAEPFPEEKSKTPKPDEWKAAPEVHVTRVASWLGRQCRVYRVREWMRVHCDRSGGGVRLLAGNASEVVLWVEPARAENVFGNAAEAIFPVRRGDGRVFELFSFGSDGWEGVSTETGVLIEEQWLEGAARPSVALLLQ